MEENLMFQNLLSKDPNPGTKGRLILENDIYTVPGWVFDKEEEIFIKIKALNRRLEKLGYSGQILYDILELGLTDINQRPVCKICGKPVHFNSPSKGYFITCGSQECKKETTRITTLEKWKDENYRNKLVNSHINWASKEENLEKLRKTSIEVWKRTEYREKQTKSHIIWASKEENLEQMRQNSLEVWKRPEYREKQTESHKEFCKNNPDKVVHGLNGVIESKKSINRLLHFDSSWERDFIILVNNMEEIISIERSNISILYKVKEEEHVYIPDFKIVFNNNKTILVEIKSNWIIQKDEKTRFKIEAGIKYVEENEEFDEYLLLKDENLCDAPHYIKVNPELAKTELLKHIN